MIAIASELKIAIRNLRRNTKRSLVATLTVSGGVIAFLLAGGFISWIFQDMREATIHSQLGHIQFVKPGYFKQGLADPYSYLLPGSSEQQKLIESHEEIISLTPRLAFSGLLSREDTTMPFLAEGIDPVGERPISSRITITAGRDLVHAKEMAVILGEGLANNLGAKPGDTVVILATAANGSPNAVELEVAGTFATISKDFDDNALRMPIDVARKLMRVSGSTSWVALLNKTESTADVVRKLRSNLSANDFQVVAWTELADFYNKTVVLFSKQVAVVKFIIGLIIILTISNTQTMSVLERTTEIGTSLAIGVRSSEILRLFLLEGFLIGIAGGAIGIALGYTIGALISAIGIPMPPPPGMVRGFTGEILIGHELVSDALFLSIFTTLLASAMPAWRASQMNIVDALRCNQ
jgi:putative ABC transport system permease protein